MKFMDGILVGSLLGAFCAYLGLYLARVDWYEV